MTRLAGRRLGLALAALAALGCGLATAESLPTPPRGKTRPVEAGPIFDHAEAQRRCPQVCTPPATWKGGWRTTKGATTSECDCVDPPSQPTPAALTPTPTPVTPTPPPVTPPAPTVRKVKAGFVKDTRRAKVVCPRVCKAPSSWGGAWRTTVKNKLSECDCLDPAPALTPVPVPTPTPTPTPTVREVRAGAIWSNDEAKQICPKVCAAPLTWKGVWRTTKVQFESVCACVEPLPPPPARPIAPTPPPARPTAPARP